MARRQARANLSQAERDAINLAQRQSQQQQAALRRPDFELRQTNTYIRRPDALLTTQERENNAIISQERREAVKLLDGCLQARKKRLRTQVVCRGTQNVSQSQLLLMISTKEMCQSIPVAI